MIVLERVFQRDFFRYGVCLSFYTNRIVQYPRFHWQSVPVGSFLFMKIKKLGWRDHQRVADIKYNIQRYGTISGLNATHVCAADVDVFGQLNLRQATHFAVVGNIQP